MTTKGGEVIEKHRCPKCGETGGYFIKRRVTLHTAFDFDGEAWDSEIVADSNATGQKKFCSDCKKDITSYVAAIAAQVKEAK